MAWARIDDQFFYNKKVAQVDGPAKLLYLASLVYAANQLTDGFIPEKALKFIASTADVANCQEFARQLLDVGLWDASDDGYIIHDYLIWNPSKQQVLATREARAESGRRGGEAKAAKDKQTASKLPSKPLAKSCQKSTPSPSPSPSLSSTNEIVCETEGEDDAERAAALTPGPTVARASTTRTVAVKPNAKLSPAVNAYAQLTGKFPPRALHHLIDAAMATRDDPDLLRRCYETWLSRGFRPENNAWLLEWYTSGAIPQSQNGNSRPPPVQAGYAIRYTDKGAFLPDGSQVE